jgi:hypothetical protein
MARTSVTGEMSHVGDEVWQERPKTANDRCHHGQLSHPRTTTTPDLAPRLKHPAPLPDDAPPAHERAVGRRAANPRPGVGLLRPHSP